MYAVCATEKHSQKAQPAQGAYPKPRDPNNTY